LHAPPARPPPRGLARGSCKPDEPTTGLDPRSRQELWRVVDELRHDGTTILLTTQYLEEADRLAQQIAVVDRGRIAAQGTAAQLKATVGATILSVRLADPADAGEALTVLASLAAGEQPRVDAADREIRLAVDDPTASAEAVRTLDTRRLPIAAVELHQPTVDDVFLTLTAHAADREPADQSPVREEAA
jgi:ABC-type multidrug transport system ATPase subunit